MKISVSVIDTAQGCAAENLEVALHVLQEDGKWLDLGTMPTDKDGRIENMVSRFFRPKPTMYRVSFATSHYFNFSGMSGQYPVIPVVLEIQDIERDYHVNLALSRFGYAVS